MINNRDSKSQEFLSQGGIPIFCCISLRGWLLSEPVNMIHFPILGVERAPFPTYTNKTKTLKETEWSLCNAARIPAMLEQSRSEGIWWKLRSNRWQCARTF